MCSLQSYQKLILSQNCHVCSLFCGSASNLLYIFNRKLYSTMVIIQYIYIQITIKPDFFDTFVKQLSFQWHRIHQTKLPVINQWGETTPHIRIEHVLCFISKLSTLIKHSKAELGLFITLYKDHYISIIFLFWLKSQELFNILKF